MFFNILLVLLTILTRFYGLKWGNGFFFHPDENNMAWAIERLSWNNLDPKFFAYGQFPLYLVYFTYQFLLFGLKGIVGGVPFGLAVYLLRFYSAIFSVLTVVVGYFLAKEVFGEKRQGQVYALLLIFTPGLIQMAHFGTTESILTFVALSTAYFSIKLLKTKCFKFILLLSLVCSIGFATKASAAIFFIAPALTIIIGFFRKQHALLKAFFSWFFLTILLTVFLSPYSFIKHRDFLGTLKYESEVALGIVSAFYTRQFVNTKPFLFQLTKIFPWTLGLPVFILFLLSFLYFLALWFRRKIKLLVICYLLLATCVPWFLFNGFLFTKWVRFVSPLFPFLTLPIVYLLKIMEKKMGRLIYCLILVCSLPGTIFMKVYFSNDIRLQATEWINNNFSEESIILSESGNVVDLPIGSRRNFEMTSFDFYTLDEETAKKEQLEVLIDEADYVLIPSRRVFANQGRLSSKFPYTFEYYQKLFLGSLGFIPLKEFKVFNNFEELLLGSDLTSEESWTVFDHPTIRIFVRGEN